MTTYSHTITLSDGEFMTMQFALEVAIERCNIELKNGPKAPFWAHLQSCLTIQEKLEAAHHLLTSSNSAHSKFLNESSEGS